MKSFSKKILSLAFAAILALNPISIYASETTGHPTDTISSAPSDFSGISVELYKTTEKLEDSLLDYFNQNNLTESDCERITEFILHTEDDFTISHDDCKYIEKILTNLEKLDMRDVTFESEDAYSYFSDNENIEYLFTENAISEPENTDTQTENDAPDTIPANTQTLPENDLPDSVPADTQTLPENDSPDSVPADTQIQPEPAPSVKNASSNLINININKAQTEVTISLDNVSIDNNGNIFFVVWSNKNGQDDIIWYPITKASDGSFSKIIKISDHNNDIGKYNIHVYQYVDNSPILLRGTTFNITETEENTSTANITKAILKAQDDINGTYTLEITVPDNISNVLVPTWTANNGQDDIIWHTATKKNGVWSVTIDSANHNYETGTYISHVYVYDTNNTSSLLKGFSVNVKISKEARLVVSPSKDYTKLDIALSNYAGSPSSLYFAVWGDANGQNDIVWYPAKKEGHTWTYSVDLSQHKETGKYNIHVYASTNNALTLVDHTTVNIEGMSNATVEIINQNNNEGTFEVKISDLTSPAGIKSVSVPIWSEIDGQDDLQWYSATEKDNVWYVKVNTSLHHFDIGTYNIHVYATDNRNIEKLVGNTTVTMKEPTPSLTATINSDLETVTLKLSHLRKAVSVTIPVWGSENGQNDIFWYTAKQTSETTWEATVNLYNHFELGTYNAHVYVTDSNKTQYLAANTQFNIKQIRSNKISIADKDNIYGTFTAQIYNASASKPITSVKMAVWTDNKGQDDLRWYTASQSDRYWTAKIDSINHNAESGTYNVHIYAVFADGTMELLGGTNVSVTRRTRIYQNPAGYYQIQDAISLSGGGYNLSSGYEGLKVAWTIKRLGVNNGNYVGLYACIYGPKTTAAVKNFQSRNGLRVTGVVDLTTWKAMGYSENDWYHLGAYVSPLRVNQNSSRNDHIEAMISTAYSYLNTPYVIGASGAPGTGVDCSGLAMQALYSAGIDMSPINPVRHASPGYEYESANMWASSKFKHVPYSQRQRGDLIFYQNSQGSVIHVAIYLGNNQVIESTCAPFNKVVIQPIQNSYRSNIKGVARPFI